VVLVGLFVAAGALPAAAQATASIEGHVEDTSGGVLPGATVTVTNVENQSSRALVTDAKGYYRALSLPVATYQVRAEMLGFRPATRRGIHLVVGQEAVIDLKLEVGGLTDEVTITEGTSIVNTTTSSVAGLVSEREVKELPLNGRSFDNLITLNPGTVNMTHLKGGGGVSGLGNLFSVGGQRPLDNLFTLNGIEYTGAASFGAAPGGVSGQVLGIDGVREINVVKDAYSAEFGKRVGGQIRVVTMSGTNDVHGSVFLFHRNDALDAKNYFDQGEIPPFERYNTGASLGGPIIKNRLFGFINFERFNQTLGLSALAIVPSTAARQGFAPDPARPGQLRNVGVAPGIAQFFTLWPEANGRDFGDGSAEYFSNPEQQITETFITGRFDLVASQRDNLSVVLTRDWGTSDTPTSNPLTGTFFENDYRVLSLEHSHVFSPNLISNLTVGYSSARFYFDQRPTIDFPEQLSFVPGRPVGQITIGGGTGAAAATFVRGGGGSTTDASVQRSILTLSERLQWSRGRHLFTLGGLLQNVHSDQDSTFPKYGQVAFQSLEAFLQGRATSFIAVPSPTKLFFRTLQGAWYVQDEIKLSRKLNVNIGLRHEFTNGWSEKNGKVANFVAGPDGVLLTAPRITTQLFEKNNARFLFGPRAALAWDPWGQGKTTVHVAGGLYYNLLDDLGFCCNANAPFNTQISLSNVAFPLRVDPSSTLPARIGPSGIETDLKTPRVLRYNLRVEHALLDTLAVSVAYQGSRGYDQTLSADLNTAVPVTRTDGSLFYAAGAPRRNPTLANSRHWIDEGRSWYDALTLEFNRRGRDGLQVRANYTFSKSLDMGSQLISNHALNSPQQVLNPESPANDKGRSSFDVPHRLSLYGTWELPFGEGKTWGTSASGLGKQIISGWQLNFIVNAQSGYPFTPVLGFNRSRNGDSRTPDRPSLRPGASLDNAILGDPGRWFDPSVFALPEAGTYGNVGRNVLRGPGIFTVDLSLFKSITVGPTRLQLRVEAFNVLDRANYGLPATVTLQQNGQASGSAGRITATSTSSRQVQLGAKVIW
jgi:hypothetical protein